MKTKLQFHQQGFDHADISGIWRSGEASRDFRTLCSFGGRFAGTASERNATEYLALRLEQILGVQARRLPVPYLGWDRIGGRLDMADGVTIPATPLGRSPAVSKLKTKVVDLGRGTRRDFDAAADRIAGCAVLVSHEYMLASGHVHRRDKYRWAKMFGASAFIIACNLPGNLTVTGSAGSGAEDDIPAVGVSYEDGRRLAAQDGEISITVEGKFERRVAENLVVDIPGNGDRVILLCAHIDGHHLSENAIDNTSGLTVLLLAAGVIADIAERSRYGLRIVLFNVEEWAVIGSKHYLDSLPEQERARIVLNINLDSVAGARSLTVLTSGLSDCEALVNEVNERSLLALGIERPFLGNSDHGNFIRKGIPAMRLCAGWNDPASNLRFLLTPADTPDKVSLPEIGTAAVATAMLFERAVQRDEFRFDRAPVNGEV